MSVDRDEPFHLVRDLPQNQALADVSRCLRSAEDRVWPPTFFASAG